MGHHTVEVDSALMGGEPASLEGVADEVAPIEGVVLDATPAPLTGELGAQLEALADQIRANYATGQKAVATAWEARYRIGEALAQARTLLRGDLEYGRWVKEQNFPFATTTQGYLTWVGNYLEEAQEIVDTGVEETGEPPALRKVAQELKNRHQPKKPKERPEASADDGDEDEIDEDLLPSPVLNEFLYGRATELFSGVPLTAEYWNQIPAEARSSAAKEFRRLIDRMVAINDFWKEA
jgi:hypothetical protein